jgi:hypothetical protein
MVKKTNLVLIILALLSLGLAQIACGSSNPHPPPTSISSSPTQAASPGLDSIDNVLKNAVMGTIAYNAPAGMQVNQTVDIQLLLSPAASPEDLEQKIVEAGQVTAAELKVTPLMKAELISDDPEAFSIQAFQDSPEQVIVVDAPTQWRWSITAKKSGNQVLVLVLSRQIQLSGQAHWSMVETYKNTIHITVNPIQPIIDFDWKWLVGILLTAILIPAFWRFIDQRNKKNAAGGSENR